MPILKKAMRLQGMGMYIAANSLRALSGADSGTKFSLLSSKDSADMTNNRKPALISGLIIAAVFFIGFFMIASGNEAGDYLLYGGLILGAIYWIWTIVTVTAADDLKKYQRNFWLIIVIAVPFFGALVYNILHRTRNMAA